MSPQLDVVDATPRDIGLSAASYLELGLEALNRGDIPRAAGALASIDSQAWAAVLDRFPGLPALIAPEASR